MMDYNKSKAQNRAINNMRGYQNMGDNGPKKIFGNISSGSNKDGLKGGKLYGKIDSSRSTTGGVGGKMSGNGYPSPPRQSMAPAGAAKTTNMKLGGGDVKAQMQPRGPGPKAPRGGNGDS